MGGRADLLLCWFTQLSKAHAGDFEQCVPRVQGSDATLSLPRMYADIGSGALLSGADPSVFGVAFQSGSAVGTTGARLSQSGSSGPIFALSVRRDVPSYDAPFAQVGDAAQ